MVVENLRTAGGSTVVDVLIEQLKEAQDLPLPSYATAGSVGMDLFAAVTQELSLMPGERTLVPTGIRIAVPDGYEAQIRPRSGLAVKHGLSLVNSPGTIDSDYRGQVQVVIINLGSEAIIIRRGDRIAQMVICPVIRARLVKSTSLPETTRGEGGFGHTGV
ncbi:MAG: dUTP diphosphatase [Armatimonadota bacterium]